MPSTFQFWRCDECDTVSETGALLTAPNPFDPASEISGCPNCKEVNCFHRNCDFPGCTKDVSGGHPMPDGSYLNRCWSHSPRNPAFAASETTAVG